jgi:hypothetical protein
MNGKIVMRVVSALVLLAAVAAIGYLAFNAGIAQGAAGIAQGQIQVQPGSVPHAYYASPFYGHHFLGLGCLGPLLVLFLICMALRAMSCLFWGPRWGHHGHWGHMHGPWKDRGNSECGAPPMFQEWHARMHAEKGPEDKD